MDEDIGVMLKCRVCLGEYNESSQRPLLLPACGHTFCAMCLKLVQAQGNVGCPECRKNNAVTSVDTLPVNFSVLSLAQAVNKASQPQVKTSQNQAKASNSSMKQKVSVKKSSHPYNDKQDHSLSNEKRRNKHEFKNMPQSTSDFGTATSIATSAQINLPSSQPSSSRSSNDKDTSNSSVQNVNPLVDQPNPSDLQDELDFQMAIHLTFCKDPNHRHDEPLSSTRGRRDNTGLSEDEQLKLALQISREEMFKN